MTDRPRPSTPAETSVASPPLLPVHELGFVGLDWLEHTLAAWFAFGRDQSAHAARAARDFANLYSAMLATSASVSLGRPAAAASPADTPATDQAAA